MAIKYYKNNESKEEDKRKQYFGLRELKLQIIFFFFLFFFDVSFFSLFFFYFFIFFFFNLVHDFNLVHITKQEQGIKNIKGTR